MPADIRFLKNHGKGHALRWGFLECKGDIIVVQDADNEYDPKDIPRLIAPILEGKADVVIGSRFLGEPHRVLFFWHYIANRFLTLLTNLAVNVNLTDMECGYKAFRRDVLQKFTLREDRFGFEPEFVCKAARAGCRIYEVGVSYNGRSYAEGKKIRWHDGIAALWCILKYGVLRIN